MTHQRPFAGAAFAAAVFLAGGVAAPTADADEVAYLVNVTVRQGYNFASATDALAYGRELCHKVEKGRPYAQLITEVKADFNTADDYHATYLIGQAVNELCPSLIWQLRNSAANQHHPLPADS